MSAIFTSTSFPTSTVDKPVGAADLSTADGNQAVRLVMSDGTTKTVFDSLTTALKCLNFMRSRDQYYLQASDEITIVNCETKLLVLESTFLNQKLLNSYVFTYYNNGLRGVHRNLSTLNTLTEALASVGFKKTTADLFNSNYDLETNLPDLERPRIKVVDYYYKEVPTSEVPGSLLVDATQIRF